MSIDLVKLATDGAAPLRTGAPEHPLKERVIEALQGVFDPEIPVNIYDLGLIYRLDIDADNNVDIDMTLTAPNCPVAGMMPGQVIEAVMAVEEVASCHVELVWEPPWEPSRMSETARLALDMY